MSKKKIAAITITAIQLLALAVFIIINQPLAAIATIALLFVSISYMRAKGFFENKIPGRFYTLANYIIGFTIAVGVLLVDYFLANHEKLNSSVFNSFYVAEITTGAIFTIAMFIADHSKHTPGSSRQKSSDIVFVTFSTVFLIVAIVVSLIANINFAA